MTTDPPHIRWGRPVTHGLTESQEIVLRYVVIGSALLSLLGVGVIFLSALRFRELSKRFFAIRLIIFLTITDTLAALIHIIGGVLDLEELTQGDAWPVSCKIQAVALIYFNLASVLWTSCFAFTLYRDIMRLYRRHALRKYEVYFHLLCWPLAFVPAALMAWWAVSGALDQDFGSWCAIEVTYSDQYLLCFHAPLGAALAFNLLIYCAVLRNSRERRVSRTTSLYLLGFAVVWLPSFIARAQVVASGEEDAQPVLTLAVLEAACSPLQGALNAAVYGRSLPSIRDVYRRLLLGDDGLDVPNHSAPNGSESPGHYSPPDHDAMLPQVSHNSAWESRAVVGCGGVVGGGGAVGGYGGVTGCGGGPLGVGGAGGGPAGGCGGGYGGDADGYEPHLGMAQQLAVQQQQLTARVAHGQAVPSTQL